jgi:membrane protease subunit (stomatin/prohibitin family)
MSIFGGMKSQLRSVIQWDNPPPNALFERWSASGDEIKNASKLIVGPGQGCIFVYEGKVEGVYTQEGIVELKTANIPFWTTITKFMQAFVSEHRGNRRQGKQWLSSNPHCDHSSGSFDNEAFCN